MTTRIRPFDPGDETAVVAFALAAWEPVFESMAGTLGPRLFQHLFGEDWRRYQERDIRRALAAYAVSVAEQDDTVVGYVAVDLPRDETHGEIYMIAVGPGQQGRGVGSLLTNHAIAQIRSAGRDMVVVETGGDPGHAPARATYEKAGFTSLPAERYYLLLS